MFFLAIGWTNHTRIWNYYGCAIVSIINRKPKMFLSFSQIIKLFWLSSIAGYYRITQSSKKWFYRWVRKPSKWLVKGMSIFAHRSSFDIVSGNSSDWLLSKEMTLKILIRATDSRSTVRILINGTQLWRRCSAANTNFSGPSILVQ